MLKIARSVLYDYSRQRIIRIIYIIMLLYMFAEMVIFTKTSSWSYFETSMSNFAASYLQMMALIAQMFIVLNTCWICTMDFGDKTANYELMSGHTRLEVFSARVLVSAVTGIGGYYLLLLTPVIVGCFIYGWGTCVDVGDMIFRWFMLIFPVLRMIIETAFMAVIVRKPAAAMLIGFILNEFFTMVPMNGENEYTSCILGSTNHIALSNIESNIIFGLADENAWIIYDTTLPLSYIAATIIIGLIASVLFFCLGYTFFRYDDID